jgi:hypothetical protein
MTPMTASATAAAILQALQFADLPALDQQLEAAESGRCPAAASALAAEEAELAAAAAGALRRAFERFRGGLAPDLTASEIPIALLRHLAARRRPA